MSETARMAALAAGLMTANRAQGHRSLIHISGHVCWTRTMAAAARDSASGRAVWIGGEAAPEFEGRPARHAYQELGQEARLVVFDAQEGFDPDAFGAVAGVVQGGGLLLLLTPEAPDWLRLPDTQQQRIAIEGVDAAALTKRYLRRLISVLSDSPEIVRVRPGAIPAPPAVASTSSPAWKLGPTDDQRQAVRAIGRVARGRARRPLVITADRGRGKSSALGMAAAELLRGGATRIVVTGPRRQAVDAVYRHAGVGTDALPFVPPADLLEYGPAADLLLVDEAAGIPLAVLTRLLQRYPRAVFSSTVHGYEGTGRGFALRFRDILARNATAWDALELTEPIRWRQDDPLERLVNQLLLLDADTVAVADRDQIGIRWLDRDALARDERLLRQVFGLLVQAHYRTRPFDLLNLLDGPGLAVAVAEQGKAVVGALLASEEGGLSETLSQAIWRGQRRPHGHLLAQSLSAHVGIAGAATARAGRVMRIAVHPLQQRRGIGTRLLDAFHDRARRRQMDIIGSSFGIEPALLRFWYRNGYAPVHVGVRRDPASAAHAGLVVQGISDAGHALSLEALRRYRRSLPVWARDYLRELEPEALWPLLAPREFVPVPAERCWEEGMAFAFADRSMEASLAALEQLAWFSVPGLVARGESVSGLEPVLIRLLQGNDWSQCVKRLGLSGRGEAVRALRAACRLLFDASAPQSARISRGQP